MPSCHYRISTRAEGLAHACDGNVHASDDTVITHAMGLVYACVDAAVTKVWVHACCGVVATVYLDRRLAPTWI